MLKLVRCVLQPQNCEAIVSSLESVARGMTIWQIRESSTETNRRATYRGRDYEVHLPSILVEIVTDDSWLDDIIAKVMKSHKDGLITGRVLQVLPVEESHDIRNGFMDI
jgi:nitrogen regulatory protein PII